MSGVERRDVVFYSGAGIRLSGHLYVPGPDVDRRCGVVFCHGFGGLKEVTPAGLASAMVQHGYTILAFDYRGFGASDGDRGRLVPAEQVEDAVCAIEYLARVISGSYAIGIYGNSFGGGIALMAAYLNRRVQLGFVSVPVISGAGWLRSLHRYHEYEALRQRAMKAISDKAVSGEMEMVDRFTLVAPDPASRERHTTQQFFTMETFFHIMHHEPINFVDRIDIPIGVIGVKTDLLVPFEQTEELYRKLSCPKSLHAFSSGNHHSIYDALLPEVSRRVIDWFDRYGKGLRRAEAGEA